MGSPRVVLLCTARRGLLFLRKLADLLPRQADLSVFSFREDPWEPPFFQAIQGCAAACGARFFEGKRVQAPEFGPFWDSPEGIDLLLAVGWRYMVPPAVYERARSGAFVFHDSLLPRYRGFSPTVWAIRNGETQTGVTLLEMVEGVDAGAIVDQQAVHIGPTETVADVMERVTGAYLEVLERNLPALLDGTAPRGPQADDSATYACRILPEDARIDWSRPTAEILDLIRSYTRPYPGAYTTLGGKVLRVWEARRAGPSFVGRVPGRVADIRGGEGVVVLTGDGSLLLTKVQVEGEDSTPAEQVLTRYSQQLGRDASA